MNPLKSRKLVTIVTEAALERTLIEDLHTLGVSGYTLCEARGEGSRGVRRGDWTYNGNIRVEVVCSEDRAHRLMAHLTENYYANYAMIAYMSEVMVLRPEKF